MMTINNPIIHDCEQGSLIWFAAKLGLASASNFGKIVTINKAGTGLNQAKGYHLYKYRLLGERGSGETCDTVSSEYMKGGIETEPQARAYYEKLYGKVEQVGFIQVSDDLGFSPDGLVGVPGGLEIKVVKPSTQMKTIDKGIFPSEHKPQVQGSIWLSGRAWWDFVSFCPSMESARLKFWRVRVYRDNDYIENQLAPAVNKFIDELKSIEAKLNKKPNF